MAARPAEVQSLVSYVSGGSAQTPSNFSPSLLSEEIIMEGGFFLPGLWFAQSWPACAISQTSQLLNIHDQIG